jgi:uncharacterized caspase-like protein
MISSLVTISSVAVRCAAVAVLLSAWSFLAPGISAGAERRIALVIANGQYKFMSILPDARRDAEAVADALRQDGFQMVTLRTDLTREAMVRAFREFRDAADNADWAMIYYSGHGGITSDGVDFLDPIDAELRAARDMTYEAVRFDDVVETVSGARALRVLVFNACQMPVPRLMPRSPPPLVPEPELKRDTLVAFADREGKACEDKNPYAGALTRNLTAPALELRRLFDRVRDEVREATDGRQSPVIYGSLSGTADFYFVPAK